MYSCAFQLGDIVYTSNGLTGVVREIIIHGEGYDYNIYTGNQLIRFKEDQLTICNNI
jgi:hypothetical protein